MSQLVKSVRSGFCRRRKSSTCIVHAIVGRNVILRIIRYNDLSKDLRGSTLIRIGMPCSGLHNRQRKFTAVTKDSHPLIWPAARSASRAAARSKASGLTSLTAWRYGLTSLILSI